MEPLRAEDPQVIGVYRLLGRLGAGGMGRVYLGRSAGGRTVAVKVVHPHFALDDQFRARFRREVAAARRVGGAWTAPVLDADPDAPVPWVATGYVAGPSLTEAVLAAGPQPERTVRALGAGLAQALAAVHALGLVHRDVKPSNVLLAVDGPRLIDFGIARATDGTGSLTATGVSVGSPGYMAPEQILGHAVTGAADVFSLGAVLAYAATGEPPFSGDSAAVLLYKVVHEAPALGPGLAGDLRSLVESCLAKDPAARPAPREIAAALAPDGAGAPAGAGWLPGSLVEEAAHRAVELLALEATAPGAPPGEYGPRPEAVPSVRRGAPAVQPGAAGTHAPPGAADPGGPATEAAAPAGAAAPAEAAEAGGARRPRRWRVLAGAVLLPAVLAVVLLYLLGVIPPSGGGGEEPPAATRSARPDAGQAAVPPGFTGTWSGSVVTGNGLANGTMSSVIAGGGKGDYVIRTTYDVLGTVQCHSKAKLLSSTADRLVLEESTDGERGALCTSATATVTYQLAPDGKIRFASDDAGGGRPTATLARTG
ncbi:protein kinase [Streptomyces sp. VNUA116]|uniref:serine/threonine-protein kinase n=1 Tax=Streptomyces sp. VNUA116 TaxID=3062449 RepID=UPI002676A43C|nr:serine/threonine-protein kinase [Streptomyces sp. VNUA116]WKU45534.1 protein kinase [Streptomyces sp. VNUA116]